jgi:hypothetical protein
MAVVSPSYRPLSSSWLIGVSGASWSRRGWLWCGGQAAAGVSLRILGF